MGNFRLNIMCPVENIVPSYPDPSRRTDSSCCLAFCQQIALSGLSSLGISPHWRKPFLSVCVPSKRQPASSHWLMQEYNNSAISSQLWDSLKGCLFFRAPGGSPEAFLWYLKPVFFLCPFLQHSLPHRYWSLEHSLINFPPTIPHLRAYFQRIRPILSDVDITICRIQHVKHGDTKMSIDI